MSIYVVVAQPSRCYCKWPWKRFGHASLFLEAFTWVCKDAFFHCMSGSPESNSSIFLTDLLDRNSLLHSLIWVMLHCCSGKPVWYIQWFYSNHCCPGDWQQKSAKLWWHLVPTWRVTKTWAWKSEWGWAAKGDSLLFVSNKWTGAQCSWVKKHWPGSAKTSIWLGWTVWSKCHQL